MRHKGRGRLCRAGPIGGSKEDVGHSPRSYQTFLNTGMGGFFHVLARADSRLLEEPAWDKWLTSNLRSLGLDPLPTRTPGTQWRGQGWKGDVSAVLTPQGHVTLVTLQPPTPPEGEPLAYPVGTIQQGSGWAGPSSHDPPLPETPSWLGKAGGGTRDLQSDRQTGDTFELPSGMSGHMSSHHPALCTAEEPSREPSAERLRSPPRRQPANGCSRPKLRAGWTGSRQKAPGKEEASKSLDLCVGPVAPSPSREAGSPPALPSRGLFS